MKAEESGAKDVDAYIAGFPPEVQKVLKKIRSTLRKVVPEAQEKISYGIATFTLNGNVIYFAGFTNHVSVFPRVTATGKLAQTLAAYEAGKGTFRFPLDKPIPYDVITEIAKLRLKAHLALLAERAARKAAKKKSAKKKPATSAAAGRSAKRKRA